MAGLPDQPDQHPAKPVLKCVWDLPTRLFHWALVIVVAVGWYLGEYRSFSTIDLHFYFGYATAGLLVFRLVWGIFGAPASRLGHLFPGPRSLWAYVRRMWTRSPSGHDGHNPLGALAVLAMIVILTAQVITGLFAEDDSMFSEGPFADWISSEWTVTLTAYHHYISRILLGAVALHLCAILFYLVWKRENLIRPMINGWKWVRSTGDQNAK